MHRNERRSYRLAFLAIASFAIACSGGGGGCSGGCSGCGSSGDGPAYVFEGNSDDHVVFQGGQVHVTQAGIDRIASNLDGVIGTVLGSDGLSFCLPETNVTVLSICGGSTCDDGSAGCQLDIGIADVRVIPTKTSDPTDDLIRVEVDLLLDEALDTSIGCVLNLSAGDGMPVAANAYLTLDPPEWERVHAALPTDELELSVDDLSIRVTGGFLEVCQVANLVLPLVTGLIEDQIAGPLNDAIGPLLCTSCATSEECPVGSTCNGESCVFDGTEECVPLDLGVEMEFDIGDLLADFAPGLDSRLGILAYAANYADAMGPPGSGLAYEGIDIGLELGFYSEANACVPYAAPPATPRVAKSPQIHGDLTPDGADFGIGIGVARSALNLAAWAAYRSGALCISIGTETVSQISSGTFSVLLPSLGDLVDGENRPMSLALRPQRPPTIDLGLGTITADGAIDDPLLTLNLRDLLIGFYVFAEDRDLRLMTLATNVAVPLALDVNDANQLVILLGDLSAALGDIETRNGELLSEADAEAVATVLPTLIGSLLPTLIGDALAPIDIPELTDGISLVIPPGGITSVDDGQMLAIFADLAFGAVAKAAPVQPNIASMHIDRAPAEQVAAMLAARAQGGSLDIDLLVPTVVLDMGAYNPDREDTAYEYSYRVNGGSWNMWQRGNRLTIHDPAMALSGDYAIDVQARRVGTPAAAEPMLASTTVTVDYVPPTIAIASEGDVITVDVADLHSSDDVNARYRLDAGAWNRLPSDGRIDAATIASNEVEVEVEATDGFGNQATEKSLVSLGDRGGEFSGPSPAGSNDDPGRAGCSTAPGAGGGVTLLLGLLGLALVRRRRAVAPVAAVALLALGLAACGNNKSGGDDDGCDPACAAGESCVDGACVVDSDCETDDDCEGGACVDGFCSDEPPSCETDADCAEGETCTDGECVAGTACETDADCAEGEYCDGGSCAAYECVEDADCGDCGEFETPRCTDNTCECEAPCADGCGEGSTCCEPRNECVELTAECEARDCETGYHVKPIADPVFDAASCEVTVECDCVEMPPLPLGNTGVYLDLGVSTEAGVSAIAAYNSTYGDLMVGIIGDDDAIDWEYVDGLPDGGEVTGSLNGPRGGIAVGGDDVGNYPSIAVGDDGALHVAYYAAGGEFRRTLLYAYGAPRTGGYDWTFLQLDATDGAGRYTNMLLDGEGRPLVGYVVPAFRTESGEYESQIRVMQATSAAPTTVDAWGAPIVVVAEPSPFPCGASCVGRQLCRTDLNVCAAPERDSACDADCGDGSCFANEDGTNVCSATGAAPEGPRVLFEGIGLFLDMEFLPEGRLGFAFYDRTNGNLVTASTDAAAPALTTAEIVDGQGTDPETSDPVDTGDAGWFPDLFVAADGKVYVSYAVATTGSLRIADLGAGTTTPVDDGVRCYEFDPDVAGACIQPMRLRVGYDSAIAEDDAGLHMVYQDATWHEILESPLGEFGWDLPGTVASPGDPYTGAYGFYLAHGVDGTGRFVVSYRLNQRAEPPTRDTVVIRR